MWPTDHWDWQMLSPSISFLLLYNLAPLLLAEYVIGIHAGKEGKHITVAFLSSAGSISAVSMTSQKVTNLKIVYTQIYPLELTKFFNSERITSFQNYFFPVWVRVLLQWEASFPPHHWFAHSLMRWVNASRIGASEWLRELLLPNELVHLNREHSDHTPGKRKSFLNAFKNF